MRGPQTWTFFQGRAKFSSGGQKQSICLKTLKKILFFLKKSSITYNFGRPAGRGGPLALTCGPMDH